jgi:hypothetical protein
MNCWTTDKSLALVETSVSARKGAPPPVIQTQAPINAAMTQCDFIQRKRIQNGFLQTFEFGRAKRRICG